MIGNPPAGCIKTILMSYDLVIGFVPETTWSTTFQTGEPNSSEKQSVRKVVLYWKVDIENAKMATITVSVWVNHSIVSPNKKISIFPETEKWNARKDQAKRITETSNLAASSSLVLKVHDSLLSSRLFEIQPVLPLHTCKKSSFLLLSRILERIRICCSQILEVIIKLSRLSHPVSNRVQIAWHCFYSGRNVLSILKNTFCQRCSAVTWFCSWARQNGTWALCILVSTAV